MTAEEQAPISKAFDKLFDTIETRQENGKTVLFNRQADNAAQTGAQNDGQRNQSGIPAGLPDVSTGASARLAEVINQDLRRSGITGRSAKFREIDQKHLPHALMAGLQIFQRITGTKVVIFRNLTPEVVDFNGVNFRDGTVYINENNQYPLTLVASHEWVHDMRKTHPLLFQQLRAEVVRQGKLAEYQERLRKDGETRWRDMDVVSEELTAAAVSDALTDPAFLQRLAERNTNAFKRMARAFLDFLNTLTSSWRDQKSNQYLQDVEAFRDKLAAVLDLYEAGDGQAGAVSKANFLRVWHGTPHRGIEQTGFKLNKIGTGEGAQMYGWGMYFADRREVAESYRSNVKDIGKINSINAELARLAAIMSDDAIHGEYKKYRSDVGRAAAAEYDKLMAERHEVIATPGQLYSANIPEDDELLDWDKPLSEQPQKVLDALKPHLYEFELFRGTPTSKNPDLKTYGSTVYGYIEEQTGSPQAASEYLLKLGIPGLRYWDGNSRGAGEGTHNYVIWDESRLTPETAKIEPMYSRSASTKAAYEARIDALFGGEKATTGTRVLDRSDVMSLLGHPNVPLMLNEKHLLDGRTNHPEMTKSVWKKVPDWLENPAAVYTDPRGTGRMVVIAPEKIAGYPVMLVVEPSPTPAARGRTESFQLLVTAYAKTNGSLPDPSFLAASGDLLYLDTKNAPEVWQRAGVQFPRQADLQRGRKKILTEKNLAGWRRENAARSTENAQRDSIAVTPASAPSTPTRVQNAIEGMFEGIADVRDRLAKGTTVVNDASELPAHLRQGAEDARAQALYDPQSKRVYMIASRIEQGQEKAVWLHEVFHKNGKDLLGEVLPRLHQAAQRWASRPANSVERQIYEAAHARALADGNYEAEFLAYAIEEAVNRGVRPNLNSNITSAGYWLARVREAFSQVIRAAP